MSRVPLKAFGIALVVLVCSAHIGSPDSWFEGSAGPYHVVVNVRMPSVIPGVADIYTRVMSDSVSQVTSMINVFDASDVEEVVLVVICEITFHLRGVHAAVRLGYINRRHTERRKNVASHPLQRHPCPQSDRDHQHDDCDWPAQGWSREVHFFPLGSVTTSSCNSSSCSRTNASTLRPVEVRR